MLLLTALAASTTQWLTYLMSQIAFNYNVSVYMYVHP